MNAPPPERIWNNASLEGGLSRLATPEALSANLDEEKERDRNERGMNDYGHQIIG